MAATATKKTSNYRADGSLTKAHVRILSFLAKKPDAPKTVDLIAKGISAKWPKTVRWALGSIKNDNRDPYSLLAKGYVKQEIVTVAEATKDAAAVKECHYRISKSGQAALAKAQAKKAK